MNFPEAQANIPLHFQFQCECIFNIDSRPLNALYRLYFDQANERNVCLDVRRATIDNLIYILLFHVHYLSFQTALWIRHPALLQKVDLIPSNMHTPPAAVMLLFLVSDIMEIENWDALAGMNKTEQYFDENGELKDYIITYVKQNGDILIFMMLLRLDIHNNFVKSR